MFVLFDPHAMVSQKCLQFVDVVPVADFEILCSECAEVFLKDFPEVFVSEIEYFVL
jgi:hypothetical protein